MDKEHLGELLELLGNRLENVARHLRSGALNLRVVEVRATGADQAKHFLGADIQIYTKICKKKMPQIHTIKPHKNAIKVSSSKY
jgi:hypothetical protein